MKKLLDHISPGAVAFLAVCYAVSLLGLVLAFIAYPDDEPAPTMVAGVRGLLWFDSRWELVAVSGGFAAACTMAAAIFNYLRLTWKTKEKKDKEEEVPEIRDMITKNEDINWHSIMEYCRLQHSQRDKIQMERFDALTRYLDEKFDNLKNQIINLRNQVEKANGKA